MAWAPRTLVIALLMGTAATMPQAGAAAAQIPRLITELVSPFDRRELERRANNYRQAIPHAQAAHWSDQRVALIYADLGTVDEYLSMYPQSEAAYRHAVALLEARPQPQLADTLKLLATLHCLMGDLRQAEKDDLHALKVRQQLGDPVAIAQTWDDLAEVYYRQRHFSKSVDYARRAMVVLADNPKAVVADRISARQTLGYALCASNSCGEAVPLLKEALGIATAAYGADSLQVGISTFQLGDAAWQDQDSDEAAGWIASGIARMKVDLGWGHPLYINALCEYVRFLRERGQTEQADAAEREMKIASAVVDVRTQTALR
jgi:tetratricopeptide (TPR) repeat protein